MLRGCGFESLDQLIDATVPKSIRMAQPLNLPAARSEHGLLNEMRALELPDPEFREQHEFLVIFRNGQVVAPDVANTLSPRQLIGLQLLQERGSITTNEYCEATGTSERTALRELRDMVSREIIVVRGRTRSARYYLP